MLSAVLIRVKYGIAQKGKLNKFPLISLSVPQTNKKLYEAQKQSKNIFGLKN